MPVSHQNNLWLALRYVISFNYLLRNRNVSPQAGSFFGVTVSILQKFVCRNFCGMSEYLYINKYINAYKCIKSLILISNAIGKYLYMYWKCKTLYSVYIYNKKQIQIAFIFKSCNFIIMSNQILLNSENNYWINNI